MIFRWFFLDRCNRLRLVLVLLGALIITFNLPRWYFVRQVLQDYHWSYGKVVSIDLFCPYFCLFLYTGVLTEFRTHRSRVQLLMKQTLYHQSTMAGWRMKVTFLWAGLLYRLPGINYKIEHELLKLSFNSFKIKCKSSFISWLVSWRK